MDNRLLNIHLYCSGKEVVVYRDAPKNSNLIDVSFAWSPGSVGSCFCISCCSYKCIIDNERFDYIRPDYKDIFYYTAAGATCKMNKDGAIHDYGTKSP